MSPEEIHAFLLSEPARTGKLAVVARDGSPRVVPIWFDLDERDLVFNTGADTLKGRSILRDGRIALCVDDDRPPFAYVTIKGQATVSEDPGELREWATRIGGRYMGAERAGEYGRRNGVPGELVVRLPLAGARGESGVAD
jgi:PPOX class probable F420-dependent enzyme